MKSILILLFVLNFGVTAPPNTIVNVKNHVFEMGSVLAFCSSDVETTEKVEISAKSSLARLYKLKEYRVKKALAFVAKLDKPRFV
ncbi:hypothetical protein [Zobellia nedashkovskayae]|uniref:hypothetical protein n=1 Tax=Zobellia nedashkovskayae TaxID=2779510 RepID=UPI00188D911F|nr:hypothetical protein [Zobellia nedashkovskayae]